MPAAVDELRWSLGGNDNIYWKPSTGGELPHEDHIEMSGQTVDFILEWEVNAEGAFSAKQRIRWPMLRTIPDDTHASLDARVNDEGIPSPLVNRLELKVGQVTKLSILGALSVQSELSEGITEHRCFFPSVVSPAVFDLRELTNEGDTAVLVEIPVWRRVQETEAEKGVYGSYIIEEFIYGAGRYRLAAGESLQYAIVRSARKENDAPYFGDPSLEYAARLAFIEEMGAELILETPNVEMNALFRHSKIRAAESIFATRGGLMHGPGGINKYLAAIWANDQAEYINPFFPYLGSVAGIESALNSFRMFAAYMNPEYKPIPSSIIAEGRSHWNGAGDRGDMAMIAYGASLFCLASGNEEWSREFWPLIKWCLEYCERQKLPSGVIASDTDELEDRFPAGEANLSTSALYYDALISSSHLAGELGMDDAIAGVYRKQAEDLRVAIETYFGAEVEGFQTYRYYEGNDTLRSWICLPLTVGIFDRSEGTVDALLSDKLWSLEGLLTESGTETVWDRSTLYALRGIFAAGHVEDGIEKLDTYTRWRLMGAHVPYPTESTAEYRQSQISAESGLYCRIFIEGLFGIRPTGWNSFECTPHLPSSWDQMALKRIHAFGRVWNLSVSRTKGKRLLIEITDTAGEPLFTKSLKAGETTHVNLD
jgi:hypothetical protein